VIVLEVPRSELRKRLVARSADPPRPDDRAEVIDKRVDLLSAALADLLDYYAQRNVVGYVHGTLPIEAVQERIVAQVRRRPGTCLTRRPTMRPDSMGG
jgi:adenylate kinase family enzyme